MRYVNDDHLMLRVHKSVIRWECQLFYVCGVHKGYLEGFVYPSEREISVPYWECDFNPFPLGYINLEHYCLYVTRWPTRQGYKQGITERNLSFGMGGVGFSTPLFHALVNTVYGIYPSFEEIYRIFNTSRYNTPSPVQAFSRYFAITPYTNTLYYKDEMVGEITQDKKYKLYDVAICLTELLEETLNVS